MHHRLISWYEKSQRKLPWRDTDDPYKIWISEVMLQQTQVHTVINYYLDFVEKFPSVQILANAKWDDLIKVWEGLGYYGRARNLHKAAVEIQNQYHSRLPDNLEDLMSLPGIGRYTAGAILSIAFNQRVPILDGNVIRVLTRVFQITDDISSSKTIKNLWLLSENILPESHVNIFNQALMELGAVCCTPRAPLCDSCPVADFCEAKKQSTQKNLPVRSPRKKRPHYDVTAGIIWLNGRFLITLRPLRGLLGGLWEFPGGKKEGGESLEECLKREIQEELGIQIQIDDYLVSVKHGYTHFKITLHVFQCRYLSGTLHPAECDAFRWIIVDDLDSYAFPAADRKVIQLLKERSGGLK